MHEKFVHTYNIFWSSPYFIFSPLVNSPSIPHHFLPSVCSIFLADSIQSWQCVYVVVLSNGGLIAFHGSKPLKKTENWHSLSFYLGFHDMIFFFLGNSLGCLKLALYTRLSSLFGCLDKRCGPLCTAGLTLS